MMHSKYRFKNRCSYLIIKQGANSHAANNRVAYSGSGYARLLGQ